MDEFRQEMEKRVARYGDILSRVRRDEAGTKQAYSQLASAEHDLAVLRAENQVCELSMCMCVRARAHARV